MKNSGLSLIILALLVVSMIGIVSAITKTVVAGKVYDVTGSPITIVKGATVNVTCTNNNSIDTPKSTLSLADGSYSIEFTASECDLGDDIDVSGFKDGLSGTGDGKQVNINMSSIDLALGVSNVALIPEFGLIVGTLTILSALGVFFVIRRK